MSTGLWMTSTKALLMCLTIHWTDQCGEWWMCMEGVTKSEQRYALVSLGIGEDIIIYKCEEE